MVRKVRLDIHDGAVVPALEGFDQSEIASMRARGVEILDSDGHRAIVYVKAYNPKVRSLLENHSLHLFIDDPRRNRACESSLRSDSQRRHKP